MRRSALVSSLSVIFIFIVNGLVAGSAWGERSLSLSEAVGLALKGNPELALEGARVAEAEATRKSTRGHYGPKLMVDGNIMVWDSELAFELDTPEVDMNDAVAQANLTPQELAELLNHQQLMSGLFKLMPTFFDLGNIRDQVTAQVSVTAAQPLTPLLQVHNGYVATRELAEAARLDRGSKEREVAHKVRETYLRVMQAGQFAEVAQTGVEQVEAHLKRARHFNVAGLIGKQDVLKAQLELARAKERVIKARYGISLASSGLALLLGLPLNDRFRLTEKVEDPPPRFGKSLEQCMEQALRQRTEIKSLRRKEQAAEAGKRRAFWDLWPQVSAVATYQHTRGQGTFMPENAFFAGGVLKWEVWDWGGKYYSMRAAAEKAQQARLGARLLAEGVQLETKSAYLELKQSEEALEVARAAITEAEENFRIEQKRFDANANTSTDVLDAQLALTRAKLSYTTALYGYYIARSALTKAMGQIE
jgi:outer membrane protein